jgi:hypothetical protein
MGESSSLQVYLAAESLVGSRGLGSRVLHHIPLLSRLDFFFFADITDAYAHVNHNVTVHDMCIYGKSLSLSLSLTHTHSLSLSARALYINCLYKPLWPRMGPAPLVSGGTTMLEHRLRYRKRNWAPSNDRTYWLPDKKKGGGGGKKGEKWTKILACHGWRVLSELKQVATATKACACFRQVKHACCRL